MKHARTVVICLLLVGLATATAPQASQAEIRLPGFFGDHMVIQQNMPIKIWGWAAPGERVEVKLGTLAGVATTAADGTWRLELPALVADKRPLTLQVTGDQSTEVLTLQDVLLGEVWLCSGQSNMEWSVQRCGNAEAEIAAGNHPLIRHLKVPRRPAAIPLDDLQADWQVCSPETVGDFSATGYYTAVRLARELDVPIGLVNSSWGGTRIEPWTCLTGLSQVTELQELYQATLRRTPGTGPHQELLREHITRLEDWLSEARAGLQEGQPISASPDFPTPLRPLTGSGDATALYNGMIHPLVGWPIRGVLWYQGEANRRDGMTYFEKKRALIQGWRTLWGQGELPFFFVQIAPFQYQQDNPEILAEFWEAQAATLRIPGTGMVVTNDIATLNDIHPPNKQDVGQRLAGLALQQVYGRTELASRSPSLQKLEIREGKLKVTLTHTAGGLKTRDGLSPTHFEIVGKGSRGFQPATATIEGDSVLLQSEDVANPVAMRFAWNKLAQPNLTGGSGLPVGAFRVGQEPTFLELLPDAASWQLVYDLDLEKLAAEIQYDTDLHAQIRSFDRVGYLLELDSPAYGEQKVFVSMKAFTDDSSKIGIPTVSSQASFQCPIDDLRVFSNLASLTRDGTIKTGNIEFWPNNYREENSAAVPGASSQALDFGDQPYGKADGYGSMQVHDFELGETIFAINHWREGADADIGIGVSSDKSSDWTFSANAKDYSRKRLRIFVRADRP